jgi:hypothetical protein
VDATTVGLAVASIVALTKVRVNSAWLIGVGGVLGWFLR